MSEPHNTAAPAVRVGILGCGNMGGALARGIAALPGYALYAHDHNEPRMRVMEELGATLRSSPVELAASVDLLILAVKPDRMPQVMAECGAVFFTPLVPGESTMQGKAVISVAAGITLEQLEKGLIGDRATDERAPAAWQEIPTTGVVPGVSLPVARVMPNTLLTAGEGLFGLCMPDRMPPQSVLAVRELFSRLGRVVELAEGKMNAFTALAGCGPAYAFYFAESLAEAGVSMGLSRADSLDIAFSLLRGAANLAQESGLHPSLLREQVTSPGGVTIVATNHLDRVAVRGGIIDAVWAAYRKGREMETR